MANVAFSPHCFVRCIFKIGYLDIGVFATDDLGTRFKQTGWRIFGAWDGPRVNAKEARRRAGRFWGPKAHVT